MIVNVDSKIKWGHSRLLVSIEEPTEGRTNGVSAEGTITSEDLVGPLEDSTRQN